MEAAPPPVAAAGGRIGSALPESEAAPTWSLPPVDAGGGGTGRRRAAAAVPGRGSSWGFCSATAKGPYL
ncbi:unnamed protein product [Spirodela intermedia]|uniref:Uncharacterized protein n=1 Tax=Spirodela intermedia TaxID=51605 RepID=A0A7I8KUZ9_SPIIN|nr:unnamed protein product [Spirodela intermedia]